MKKKSLCLIGCLALLLSGCGGNNETPSTAEVVTTAEQKTEEPTTASTEATTKATENKLSDREAKNKDVYTGASLSVIFAHAMADEKAFDEFYPHVKTGGIGIVPEADGTYTLFVSENGDYTNLAAIIDGDIAESNLDVRFYYSTDDLKPNRWFMTMDPETLEIHVVIVTEDDKVYEVSPNIDAPYK